MGKSLGLLTIAFVTAAPALAQVPAPQYRRLEISVYYCQSLPYQASDGRGCISPTDPGKTIWPFPNCHWRDREAASCTAKATPNPSGQLGPITASCSAKKFEKAASDCLRVHRIKPAARGDLAPVCMQLDFPARKQRIRSPSDLMPPEGPTIRELPECPTDSATPPKPE